MSLARHQQQTPQTNLSLALLLALLLHLLLFWPGMTPSPSMPIGAGANSTQPLQLQISAAAPKQQTSAPITDTPPPAPTKPVTPRKTLPQQAKAKSSPKPKPIPQAITAAKKTATRQTAETPSPAVAAKAPPVELPTQPQTASAPGQQAQLQGNPQGDAYKALLRQRLQSALRYPRSAQRLRQQGVVEVRFWINEDGQLQAKQVELLKGSGIKSLDRAALASVRRAAPFPAPPQTLIAANRTVKISLPVEFQLN